MSAGKDVSLSYQGFCALDNVQFVNGNQLGTRLMFQVRECVSGNSSLSRLCVCSIPTRCCY